MRHEVRLEGEAFRLRPLELADAEFVVGLRTHESLSRFLNETSASLQDQRDWTARYFERRGDFYFIVERADTGAPEGAIALYDEEPGRQAQWGRWVLRPGSLAAPESALLLYRFGFEARGLTRLYCRTLAANTAVVAFHDACGLNQVGPVGASIEHALEAQAWPAVEARLRQGASRSAALLRRRGG